MTEQLNAVIDTIAKKYENHIRGDSRYYLDVSIAEKAGEMGYSAVKEKYKNIVAIVPIKQPTKGMKVRVDGRTFVNYAQFESGVVVPNHVARQTGITYKAYVPWDSMIYNYQ